VFIIDFRGCYASLFFFFEFFVSAFWMCDYVEMSSRSFLHNGQI
jgi:hypothetical protein